MAVNKPSGDNARKGAVKKRSQTKTTIGGASAWAKRNKKSGEFMGLKRPGKKKKAAKKFKGGPGGEKEDDQEAHIEEESRGKEEITSLVEAVMDLSKCPRCAGMKPVFSSSGRTELRCPNCEQITVERAASRNQRNEAQTLPPRAA